MMKKKNYRDYLKVIPGILLVAALIAIVFGTGISSKNVIERQAKEYLKEYSDITADELGKTFARQEESIATMAHMTAHIMDFERIDTEKLVHLVENSSFDGIEYIHPNGSCYGMNGVNWDVSEKEYFKEAVQQKSGYAFDDAPERGTEGSIVFYAPIVSDAGDFYGILSGYFSHETVEGMLSVSFFGHDTKQYLLTMDGTIAANNCSANDGSSILNYYTRNGWMNSDESGKLADLIKKKSGSFEFLNGSQKEIGSVSDLGDGQFLHIETFPPEVLTELTQPTQDKMHLAFLHVAISLVFYGVFMIARSWKNTRSLEEKNDQVSQMLKGAEEKANHDELTGLLNRRGMIKNLTETGLEERDRALLLLDIDNFKKVNDQHGHKIGDALLKKVAQLLKESFREDDLVVRMGGDEFVVVLSGLTVMHSDVILRKVAAMNEKLMNPGPLLPPASLSVGAAFSRPGETDELFIRADKALYRMKEMGRCGCCIYEDVFDGSIGKRDQKSNLREDA